MAGKRPVGWLIGLGDPVEAGWKVAGEVDGRAVGDQVWKVAGWLQGKTRRKIVG